MEDRKYKISFDKELVNAEVDAICKRIEDFIEKNKEKIKDIHYHNLNCIIYSFDRIGEDFFPYSFYLLGTRKMSILCNIETIDDECVKNELRHLLFDVAFVVEKICDVRWGDIV